VSRSSSRRCARARPLACGGLRRAGLPRDWFFAPTLLTDVRNSMSVAREEVFDPVFTMLTHDDMDDAVAIP
jgi:aldehyde dehydrogenase (NAD+)